MDLSYAFGKPIGWTTVLMLALVRTVAFSLVVALPALDAYAAPLRICAAEWPPFTQAPDAQRQVGGIHAARVTRIMGELGYQVSIHVVAWERCLKDLADGFYAAAYPGVYRRDREAFAVYPAVALDSFRYVAVVRQGEGQEWSTTKALAALPQPIGVPKGWALLDELTAVPGVVIDESAQTMEQNVRKVLAGRLGTAIVEARTARDLLARLDPRGALVVLEQAVTGEQAVYLLVGRKALGNWGARQLAEKVAGRLQSPDGGGR